MLKNNLAPPAPFDPESGCALIQIQEVGKIFKTHAGEFPALKNINLCFGQGEYASIMGKSGSGKSTLINMITGIDHPTSGSVRVAGMDIHHMKESEMADWRGRNLGIVFQFFQLLPMLSVLENTMLPMDFCNVYSNGERERRAMALLDRVGLSDAADKLPAALSGGQQQMAAIARALANDPSLIVADEPTGNLDSRTARRILDIFDELVAAGKTIIIVTHDGSLAQRAKRQVLISDGEIINEHLAVALPHLPHNFLLRLTHLVDQRIVDAGARLTPLSGFYVIANGQVEVVFDDPAGERIISRLVAGNYFSELELGSGVVPGLSFRASSVSGVALQWLSHETFNNLMVESHIFRDHMKATSQERLARYQSFTGSAIDKEGHR